MENTIARLQKHLHEVPQAFRAIPDERVTKKPAPQKWSPLEILGHLCDSATNNLGRFVRAQQEVPYRIVPYQQNEWVRLQGYQERPAEEIVQLWTGLNQSVLRVMRTMPPSCRQHACETPDGASVTLEWLMTDYVDHLEHHLRQIFTDN
ncbi:DinB family protein [Brevibacillus choshinensis]|uniref:DinB family protein n=1 Tax=Brevibacillus choshinensis TaxID=54911 RepID=A0ABX7FS62_BRECH|nr:DinB family protein [Brevibacillus choshinensis]QRG69079.1 DinB family protein [Brevibacillus choshinensis]